MNGEHHNTAPVDPASFLDLEEPIAETFYMATIACDLAQNVLSLRSAERLEDNTYRFYISKDDLDTMEFAAIRAAFLARSLKAQFHAIVDERPNFRPSLADPLLKLVKEYEAGFAAYNAAPEPVGEEAERALVASTYGPPFAVLKSGNVPKATTRAGALAALRMLQDELRHSGGDGEMATAILPAVLTFLEQEAA